MNCSLICSEEESVTIQKQDIFGKIKLTLSYLQRRRDLALRTSDQKLKLMAKRIFINLVIFAILGSLFVLIYWVVGVKAPELLLEQKCQSYDLEFEDLTDFSSFKCFAIEYLPSVVVTISNLVAPFVFGKLILYEEYEANTKLLFNLARCIFLRLASVLVTLFSLQKKVNCDYAEGCIGFNGNLTTNSRDCKPDFPIFKACSNENLDDFGINCEKPICWETYVGQQLYKLTLVDFLVQLGVLFLFDGPRRYLIGHCLKGTETLQSFRNAVGVINFDVTKHVLDIVYSQTICWVGIFYAPLLSLVTVIKLFILFYLRLFHVNFVSLKFSRHQEKEKGLDIL